MTDVLIVIPVYNERIALEGSVRRLHGFLERSFPFSWQILIADNASVDGTHQIARRLTYELDRVDAMRLPKKGRGRALRAAWSDADARVLCYMDVDLSTDLTALLPLVAPLASGHSDVAIGTRLARRASVTRSRRREFISRTYNRLLRFVLRSRFSDAQCGFKAVRRDIAAQLLPAGQRRGVVLRHRAPRRSPSVPGCGIHRGPGRLGRRRRLPRPGDPDGSRRPARCRAAARPQTAFADSYIALTQASDAGPMSSDSLSYPARNAGPSTTRLERVRALSLAKPEIVGLIGVAAVLNLWGLSANGWANTYYSAAVRSISSSWHNFLFASMDPSGLMTVDKPPLSL